MTFYLLVWIVSTSIQDHLTLSIASNQPIGINAKVFPFATSKNFSCVAFQLNCNAPVKHVMIAALRFFAPILRSISIGDIGLHITLSIQRLILLLIFLSFNVAAERSPGHEQTLSKHEQSQFIARAEAALLAEGPEEATASRPICRLTINVLDDNTNRPLAATVRITNLDSGKAVKLSDQIHRAVNWYALPAGTTVMVPQTKLKIEAIHGVETEAQILEVDATATRQTAVEVRQRRFYDCHAKGLFSGNTHLHLMEMTYSEALHYLRIVPQADGLDLVFLSHLRRLPDESQYVSNKIVENSFQKDSDLKKLSQYGTLYSNGEEHRHNFGRHGEGYGHVMFLNMPKLIRPVSIGPGLMGGKASDGIPLQQGVLEARRDGDTIIWCHNARGYEDVPNMMAGLIDAQNINDGSTAKSYQDSFYKYLNIGIKVVHPDLA